MIDLWTEKFRPKTIADYVFTDNNQRQIIESWVLQTELSRTYC